MPPHVAFFWGTVFFLLGVLLKSFFSGTVVILAAAGIFLFLLVRYFFPRASNNTTFQHSAECWNVVFLTVLIVLGGFYYHFYDSLSCPKAIPYGIETTIQGKVVQAESRLSVQMITMKATEPFAGKVRATISPNPVVRYGDDVALSGKLERPEAGSYERYLKKDNIFAIMSFPDAKVVNTGKWTFRGSLYSVSDRVQGVFSRIFPAREAALMSGLTLGDTSQFTKEFKEAMQRTGTTHIVALSGYNVMVIVSAALALFSYFLRRRAARWCAFFLIMFFVLLTGAAASVVRAAIMAFLVMYLTAEGRMRASGNIVAATALAMVLWNPRVLAFDVGFQLSFLAFLGIVYIAPRIQEKLKRRDLPIIPAHAGKAGEPCAGSVKQAFAYTVSAQLMTLPFLVLYFDRVFVSSVIPNVLVVALVPLTMALGFLTAGVALLAPQISFLIAYLSFPFLRLETLIIEFFSRIAFFPISVNMGIIGAILYYALLLKLFFLPNNKNTHSI